MVNKNIDLGNEITRLVNSYSPIKANGYTVEFNDIKFDIPEDNFDLDNQLKMKYSKNGSTEGYVSANVILKDSSNTKLYNAHFKKLIVFPVKTDRGTYIVNGTERNLISQMRMKPGIYSSLNSGVTTTNLRFSRKSNTSEFMPSMSFILDSTKPTFKVNIKSFSSKDFNILNFMTLLGFTESEMRAALGNSSLTERLWETYGNKRFARTLDELFKIFYSKENSSLYTEIQKKNMILEFFSRNASFGDGAVVRDTLGISGKSDRLTKDILIKSIKKTMLTGQRLVESDVKDNLKYKDVYSSEDLITDSIDKSLLKLKDDIESKLMNFDRTKKPAYLFSTMSKNLYNQIYSTSGLMNGELSVATEEINPLFMEAKQREISQSGEEGLSADAMKKEVNARNLTNSSINRIDPIETPESPKIGITQHLSSGSRIKNNTLTVPVYKVMAGKAKISDKNEVELSCIDEEKHIIAFNDSRYVTKDGDSYVFTEDVAPCRFNGAIKNYPVTSIKYIDTAPQNIIGNSANMIPFVGNDDGARGLMGAAMQKQAINLVNREAPLVTTIADERTGQTTDQKIGEDYGKPVRSLSNGKVTNITNSKIIVKSNSGKEFTHQYYNYFPLNQSYINNELTVSVGDVVQKGQILAEGWQTKDGKLALGSNARIGYMPYKGLNYEDGVVVSESFANKMTSAEYQEIEVDIPLNAKGGKGSNIKETLIQNSNNASISLLDNDGIIKVGTKIKQGSTLVGFMKEVPKESTDLLDMISLGNDKTDGYRYSEKQVPSGSYTEGVVERINVIEKPDNATKQKIVFSIVTQKKLKTGDKIAGRHGNKGTISAVLPDEEMPHSEDGKSLDILMSPLAIPSRKNTGQLFEGAAGLIAEKTGKQFVVRNFDHTEKERVFKELKNLGIEDGKMNVTLKERDEDGNLINIPLSNKITVGNAYFMKLKHKVDDKIQGRSNKETPLSSKTYMPLKSVGNSGGERSNPQRIGEMEMSALLSHGATWNVLEMSTIKSDGGGNAKTKAAIFNAIATGKLDSPELDRQATPETVKVLKDTLKGLGLDVKSYFNGAEVGDDKPFAAVGLCAMNQKKFLETIGKDKQVFNAKSLQTRQLVENGKRGTVAPETKGGLLDPEIFGTGEDETDRNKWGYIKLPAPTANPMFLESNSNDIYSKILGIKHDVVKDIAGATTKPKAVITNVNELQGAINRITNPELREVYKNTTIEAMKEYGFKEGDIVDVSTLDNLKAKGITIPYKAGGFALEHLLSKVNVDEEINKAKQESEASKDHKVLSNNFKKIKALENLKKNDMSPKDLMLNIVPVVPSYLRPINFDDKKGQLTVSDLDKLYQSVIVSKHNAEKEAVLNQDGFIENQGLAPKDVAQRSKGVYESIKKLQGMSTSKVTDSNGKELVPLKNTLSGKKRLIRKDMLGKRQDFSGRSVITINPDLALDEAAIPIDMAKQMYKPFVMKKMIEKGLASEFDVATKFDSFNGDVKKVLQEVANERPVLLNRAPTLHKYGLMAFKPVIKEKDKGSILRSIQLNPLTVTAFNADFDGDQMSAHVPLSDLANEEAKKILTPVNNLINVSDGSMLVEIRHEMALGIYQITKTWRRPSNAKVREFRQYKDLLKEYSLGRIKSNDMVRVPISIREATAGQALFNWIIPEKLKHHRNFYKDWTSKEVKKLFKTIYEEAEINNFSKISKMDISNMLNQMKNLGFKASTLDAVSLGLGDFKLDKNTEKKLNNIIGDAKSTVGDWSKVENKIENELKKGLLPEDNPLQIMMTSGSRANPQQIRKMFATIGVGMDVEFNKLDPIKSSHFAGLSPQEFFGLGKDSRKGMYDRSVSTSEPGALTRELIGAAQEVTIKEVDCKTNDFISLKKDDGSIKGRFAGKDILSENGSVICKKNQIITPEIISKIFADDTIKYIPVRSVSRCKTVNGKCQKCYGATAGTLEVVKLGTAIGIIAAQAVGEPVTQMTMNTFHTGGANSSATIGIKGVKGILNLNPIGDKALLAKNSGTVTKIDDLANQIIVYIDNKAHKLKKGIDGSHTPIKVKEGDFVKAGDFLTRGDNEDLIEMSTGGSDILRFSSAKPKDIFKLKSKDMDKIDALNYAKDYVENSMSLALQSSKAYMDRRHTEVIVGKLMGSAMVVKQGDSPFLPGQIADINLFEKWNRENTGKNLIEYDVEFSGKTGIKSQSNWVNNIANVNVKESLTNAALLGSVDNLEAPKARQMLGKAQKMDDMFGVSDLAANSVNNKMRNFFTTDKVKSWLNKNKK